jgi:hypothetical protein
MRYLQALLSGAAGAAALIFLIGARYAYGEFQPMRGYTPLHAHVMASQEGLFLALYVVLGAVAAAGLGGCAALLLRWPIARWCGELGRRLPDWGWILGGGLWAALASLLVARELLDGAFLTDDEMAMLFQARLLTEGRLWAEPTPFPGVLHYAMMVESPRWYGIYPSGHPAVMALSLLLTGDPRVIMALVAAGWVALTFLLARRLYDRSTAAVATVLLGLSPFFVLSSGSLAAQLSSGLFLLAAANVAVRLDDWPELGRWANVLAPCALGLSLGAAYLVRPWSALIVGLVLACWVGRLWLRREIPLWSPLLVLVCGAPFAVAYLGINEALTGTPWLTPYEVNFPGRFHLGFGQDAFGVTHTPRLALGVAGLALVELNVWTLGWPLSLLPVGACLALERPPARALAIVALPAAMILAHLPVPMAGVHDTGPLYYLEILPALTILAARGLVLATRRGAALGRGRGRDLVVWMAVAATFVGAFGFWSQQVTTLHHLSELNRAPYELAERIIPGRALVFVDEIQTSPPSSWVLGLQPPRPDLSDRIIYANVVRTELAAEVLRWAEDRQGWFLSRDQETGEVSLVPLPAPPRSGGRDQESGNRE